MLEIAKHFGFESASSIRKIFTENNWETRKKGKKIDSDLVYNLYFDQGLSLAKVKTKLGLSSLYPIVCIFEEQGWDARPAGGRRKVELDQDEVYRLYYKEDMTMQQIARLYGYKTSCVISRIFRKNGWDPWRTRCVDSDIDVNEVQRMYFEEKLPLTEIQRRLGKTGYAINKVFIKMEWEKRKIAHETEEERKRSQKESSDRYIESVKELREELFGSECEICGTGKNTIHHKDGKRHSSNLLWSKKGLKSIDPNEWAVLCKECHLVVHTLMRINIRDWKTIVSIMKDVDLQLQDRLGSK